MTWIDTWAKRTLALSVVTVISFLNTGCTSPPSVAPLLQITERALLDESARLDQDVIRDRNYTRQSLASLEDAYNRDLDQRDELTGDWVREATAVYVASREAVIAHQMSIEEARSIRADNLRDAAAATSRAIALIEQQDKLLHGVLGDDLTRLLNGLDDRKREPSR